MNDKQIKAILESKNIRISPIKERILGIFLQESIPLSAAGIHQKLANEFQINLTSVYRSLHLFKERGILREVLGGASESYFELATGEFPLHPHLWCKECKQVICLPPLSLEETLWLASTAKAHEVHSIALSLEGRCAACLQKTK